MIHIDADKCTKCGACVEVCPALVIERNGGPAEFIHKASCIKCYHCVAVCPVGAVSCEEFPLDAFKTIPKTKPVTPAGIRNLLMQRRSVREFRNREVGRKVLDELVETASHAPTGHNDQGVRLVVVTDRKLIDRLDARIFKMFDNMAKVVDNPVAGKIVKAVAGEKKASGLQTSLLDLERFKTAEPHRRLMIFRGAPVLVVAHVPPGMTSGKDDCVIALTHMMTHAEARGLGCTWIGFLVGAAKLDPTLKKPLGIPTRNAVCSAMVMGYPKYRYKRTIPRKTVPVKWID